MVRTVLKLVMTAVAMLCIASVCAGQEASPLPSPTGFVNDYAGVIDAATKDQLERRLKEFRDRTNPSVEIAVAVVFARRGIGTYSIFRSR